VSDTQTYGKNFFVLAKKGHLHSLSAQQAVLTPSKNGEKLFNVS